MNPEEKAQDSGKSLEGRILIVDDEQGFRTLIEQILKHEGYSVDQAETVEEGMAKLKSGNYDVAVIDLVLRDRRKGGIELILELDNRRIETDAILISAHSTIPNILEAFRAGASDVIDKNDHAFRQYLVECVARIVKKKRDYAVSFARLAGELNIPDLRERIQDEQFHSSQGSGGRRKEDIPAAEALRRVLAKKIMIVTENNDRRIELEDMLRPTYNVITAGDFNAALGLVSAEIDLVIIDASPKGYAIAEQIKEEYRQVDIVLATDNDELLSQGASKHRARDITTYDLVKWTPGLLEETVKSVIFERTQEDLVRKVASRDARREILEKQVAEDPANTQKLFELAEFYRREGDLEKAKGVYENIFSLDKDHIDALCGIIDVQERLEERAPSSEEGHISSSFVNWIRNLRSRDDDPRVQLGLVRAGARTGNVDEVIKYCKRLIENDPANVEAHVRLCEAYIRKGNKRMASKVLDAISQFPKNELFIGLEHTEAREGLQPGLVLAEISKHRVYGIVPKRMTGPNIIIKIYEKGNRESARNDFENLTFFSKNSERLGANLGVPRPILLKDGEDASVLMAERIEGIRADRAYAACSSEEERLCYLERLVDATVAFALLGSKRRKIRDVRDKRRTVRIGRRTKQVGYFTSRFDDKFIQQYASYGGIVIPDEKRLALLDLHSDINTELLAAPSSLYLLYTDCNFRNFLIPEPSGGIEKVITEIADPKARVRNLRKARIVGYDKESDEKTLFLIDLITLLEHEIVDRDMRRNHTDYLIQRAMLGLMSYTFRDEHTSAEIDSVLRSYSNKRFRRVKKTFDKYFSRFMPNRYSQDQFQRLVLTASAQRHLTILGDKERDIYRLSKIMDDLIEQHETLRLYEKILAERKVQDKVTFARELEARLKSTEMKESEKRALRDYLLLSQSFEELVRYRQIHRTILRMRLNETKRTEFREQLDEVYFK